MKILSISIKYLFFLLALAICLNTATYADPPKNTTPAITTQKIAIAGHDIYYDTIGQGDNILLVHGLFASKSQWQKLMPFLAEKGYHVIAPDLPGYGKSQGFDMQYYAPIAQVKLLHQFVSQLNIDKVNIAGSSMGGYLAALYAKEYPEEVATLAFIGGPFGVQTPKSSKIDQLLAKGINPFIPTTEKEFNRELSLLFNKPPALTPEKKQEILKRYQTEKDKYLKIWAMTTTKNKTIFNKPFDIKVPTLIIWGDQDQVFDVSGAPILQKNIANSELVIVGNGSHLLFMEDPQDIAKHYLNFLTAHK